MCTTILQSITAGKDIVLSLAAIATATVAIKGLSTWNRELRGKASFDVARSLAKSAYKVRDKLQQSRSPLLSAREFPDEYHEGGLKKTPEQEANGYAYLYSNRWSPVWEVMQEFDASTLEAEALWGSPVREATDQLRKVVREVSVAIEAIISNAAANGEDFSTDREFGKKMRSTVSALPSDAKNELNIKLSAAVEVIDNLLRPHLRRS
jgi:hypothetical protein